MAKRKYHEPLARMSLELPLSCYDTISRLKDDTDAASMTEVIRRALGLYDHFYRMSKAGGKFYEQAKGDPLRELVVPGLTPLQGVDDAAGT